jgi:hypothetical protein
MVTEFKMASKVGSTPKTNRFFQIIRVLFEKFEYQVAWGLKNIVLVPSVGFRDSVLILAAPWKALIYTNTAQQKRT